MKHSFQTGCSVSGLIDVVWRSVMAEVKYKMQNGSLSPAEKTPNGTIWLINLLSDLFIYLSIYLCFINHKKTEW
jgi:hypothetical protein